MNPITSGGKVSTDAATAKTLLSASDGPYDGVLQVWTFDDDSGAGTLRINGEPIEIDGGAFSLQIPIFCQSITVTLTREGATNMSNWQAVFSRLSGT